MDTLKYWPTYAIFLGSVMVAFGGIIAAVGLFWESAERQEFQTQLTENNKTIAKQSERIAEQSLQISGQVTGGDGNYCEGNVSQPPRLMGSSEDSFLFGLKNGNQFPQFIVDLSVVDRSAIQVALETVLPKYAYGAKGELGQTPENEPEVLAAGKPVFARQGITVPSNQILDKLAELPLPSNRDTQFYEVTIRAQNGQGTLEIRFQRWNASFWKHGQRLTWAGHVVWREMPDCTEEEFNRWK